MFFSIRCDGYDIETMIKGEASIRLKMDQIRALSRSSDRSVKPSKKDQDVYATLELALEMVLRGYRFSNIDINRSAANEFIVDPDDKNAIIPPFTSIDGLGESVAVSIVKAREEAPFLSKEDLLKRTSLSLTADEDAGGAWFARGHAGRKSDDVILRTGTLTVQGVFFVNRREMKGLAEKSEDKSAGSHGE